MRSTHSYEEVPTNGYQTPGSFSIKGCYVKTLTSSIEPYQTLNQPHSFQSERVDLLMTVGKSWKTSTLADLTSETN